MVRWGATLLTTLALLGATAAPAQAVPDCKQGYEAKTLLKNRGLLETVVVDNGGRIVFGDLERGLFRIKRPGAEPVQLADHGGSGLAWGPRGTLTSGSIDLLLPPQLGIVGLEAQPAIDGALTAAGLQGHSTLALLDRSTRRLRPVAAGLSLVNGVAYDASRDAFYTTNHEGAYVVRVQVQAHGGVVVDNRWARVPSANGVVLRGHLLYLTVTFGPPLIVRLDVRDPKPSPEVVAMGGPEDAGAALDGLREGPGGTMLVVAHGSGELWQMDADGSLCALVRGLDTGLGGPSDVAVGRGPRSGRLYVTTFSGKLLELSRPGA